MHLNGLDYGLIIAYLALMAGIGIFFGWFVKDAGSYLKGGNTIPWFVSGTSNFMSMFSTFMFVAYAGIAYEHGLVSLVVFWSTVPACIIAGKFMAARWRRAEITTPIEYLEQRYSLSVRQLYSWLGLLKRFLDNAVRLYASGVFLATVTPLSVTEAVVVSGLLTTFYTLFGGLWAVTVMDTIQFIVLLFTTVILLPLSLLEAGGLSGIVQAQPHLLDWFNGPKGQPLWLLVYYVMITLKYNENWAFVQRLYSVRDEASAKKVAYCSAFLFLATPVIFLLPAIAAKVILPDLANPEQSYVALCQHLLPAGMLGLMVASMFSATASALNSEFNVMAGVVTTDIYKRFRKTKVSEKNELRVARIATAVIGIVITTGAVFVQNLGGAFEANKIFTGILAIPLAIPMLLGLWFAYQDSKRTFAVVVGGALFALALNVGAWFSWELSTMLTIIFCLGIFLFPSRGKPVSKSSSELFRRLKTPLAIAAIPRIDPGFRMALGRLFGLSLLVSGAFFIIVGVIAFNELSGQLSLGSGLFCSIIGLMVYWRVRKTQLA